MKQDEPMRDAEGNPMDPPVAPLITWAASKRSKRRHAFLRSTEDPQFRFSLCGAQTLNKLTPNDELKPCNRCYQHASLHLGTAKGPPSWELRCPWCRQAAGLPCRTMTLQGSRLEPGKGGLMTPKRTHRIRETARRRRANMTAGALLDGVSDGTAP